MNHPDRIASDPAPRIQSEDAVVSGLASFVPEAAFEAPSRKLEQPRHPLWEFPAEGWRSTAAAANDPAIRKPAIYVSLVAAIFIAAVAGALWGELIPGNRPVTTAATSPTIEIAPVVTPSADASSRPPDQLIPSVDVRPSARPPVAPIVPMVAREETGRTASPPPGALSGAAPDRQSRERVALMARGTTGRSVPAPTSRLESPPPAESIPTAPMVVANPAVRSLAPEPPPAPEASVPTSPPSRIAAAVLRPEPEALPSVVVARTTDQSEIQRTLGQYRSAYQSLDAEAARAVWPSVDVRALARAFDSLTSQQLAFESCEFDITREAATAQCRGSATYTPKVGNRGPRLEPRQWTFLLRKVDEGWKIQSAQTRR